MEQFGVIVIGASAGGVEALRDLFQQLRPFPQAAIFVVVHIPTHIRSNLPDILSRAGDILVEHAADNKPIQPGSAYVAPPNRHLLLQDGAMRLVFGPKENGFRPAVDPLFRSAAGQYGSRVIGVILSGNLYDGTRGMIAIKQAGGLTVVQDPQESLYPGMPSSVLSYMTVDHVLSVTQIAALLNAFSHPQGASQGEKQISLDLRAVSKVETDLIRQEIEAFEQGRSNNQRSVFTCPDCGGVLWELQDGSLLHYRCHVGHAYTPETLFAKQDNGLETAFWSAMRLLVEKAALSNRLAARAARNGNDALKDYYLDQARKAEKDAEVIRSTWFQGNAGASRGQSADDMANSEVTTAHE